MYNSTRRPTRRSPRRTTAFLVAPLLAALLVSCAPPNSPETVASPVTGASRSAETLAGEYGHSYDRRADDGTVVGKLHAPPEAVWAALAGAYETRKVTPAIYDRAVGRMGDTSVVMMRRWNGQQVSRYFNCGNTMTGARADEERVRAVLLAQMTRLAGDTIAVAVHLSGASQPIASGNSGVQSQCTSTGRAEAELLDDIIRRVGGQGKRT